MFPDKLVDFSQGSEKLQKGLQQEYIIWLICGPGYQRFSTEISGQAWFKGSRPGARVPGKACREGKSLPPPLTPTPVSFSSTSVSAVPDLCYTGTRLSVHSPPPHR